MKKIFFYFIFYISIIGGIFAQKKHRFTKEIFVNEQDTLLYNLLKPDNFNSNQKYPLVIFLHGAGERGNDNESQLIHSIKIFDKFQSKYPCFVIAPQCPKNQRWVEIDWRLDSHKQSEKLSTPLKLTIELLNFFKKNTNIDKNKIFVTGLSMGGFGTWELLSRLPNEFACAVPVCGGGDENQAYNMKNTDIWAFHGGKDKVVKVQRSRNMVQAIKKLSGKKIKYTEFKNIGHFCWNKVYNENLLKWMFSHSL